RKEKYNFWKNVYIVDNRQSHHFRQLFRVAELLGFEGVGDSKHVEFGFMKLPEGAMSTRAGNTISLDAVLDEAELRARKVIKEKNPDLKDADEVAKKVGLGAIKFFDLSHNRRSDVVFRWEDVLSFEGNTGPYIQYTYARLKSILRKSGEEKRGG
ncbi:MAG: arginine--tRNA ligase, partial [Patescibacteria group bacterium]